MDWTRGRTLGRGSTAAVYIAESRRSGEIFAVKSAELNRSDALQKEQGLLSTLNYSQIVTYQGYDVTYEDGTHWYNLFMEYAPRGTLVDLFSSHNGAIEEALVVFYTRQILLGLNYLHSNGIVHCDVKGQNVLVTDQGAKIADLGCARRVGSGCGGVIAGTPAFMAPEVARGEQQGFPADVWALGCTVLEMITGKPPWHGVADDPVSALYRVGFSGEAPEVPGFVSEQGKDFLGKCLRRDPSERWTIEELLGHGFVAESRLEGKEFAFGTCDSDTPTSVLERGLWDSLETNRDLTRGCCFWDTPSPRDRVRRLCGGEPVWEWDDGKWITVRSNDGGVKEFLWVPGGEDSIEETEDCGSDSVGILREENVLVIFHEPKVVIGNVIQLSRWNVVVDDFYICSIDCGRCNRDSLFLGCSCLKIDYPKKEIFITHGFLLSLFPSLFFNSTLDELGGVQFKIAILQWKT